MLGVTEIINFGKRRYGCDLGAQVRDTLQNVTLPFFKSRRLVLVNPDNPRRTATSRYCVHQLDELAIALVKSFGTDAFPSTLAALMSATTEPGLSSEDETARECIWITLPSRAKVGLVRDDVSELTRSLLEVFCAKFAPGGRILYVADSPIDHPLRQGESLLAFGCAPDTPGNLPDLVVHDTRKNRLVLVDASDGEKSIDEARRRELEVKFAHSSRRLVMVTAFASRVDLVRTIDQISSDTRAWVAECPSRLIQFNSGRNSSVG